LLCCFPAAFFHSRVSKVNITVKRFEKIIVPLSLFLHYFQTPKMLQVNYIQIMQMYPYMQAESEAFEKGG
jgi:hypothetical protein